MTWLKVPPPHVASGVPTPALHSPASQLEHHAGFVLLLLGGQILLPGFVGGQYDALVHYVDGK